MIGVQAPAIEPVVGGLLAHVTPVDLSRNPSEGVDHYGWLEGRTDFIPTEVLVDEEDPDGPTMVPDKVFSGLTRIEGEPFTVYRGAEESLLNIEDLAARLNEAYDATETFAVERGFAATVLSQSGIVDLTPTGGVAKRLPALGVLEQWAAENIVGKPYFHTDRYGAALLDTETDGDRLLTKQGTPVVNGGGYRLSNQPVGTFRVYVTSRPGLWRGPLERVNVPLLRQNRNFALVERQYVATVSPKIAYVNVTPDA